MVSFSVYRLLRRPILIRRQPSRRFAVFCHTLIWRYNVVVTGLAEEFDNPSRLLERASLFGALVQEYANRSSGL